MLDVMHRRSNAARLLQQAPGFLLRNRVALVAAGPRSRSGDGWHRRQTDSVSPGAITLTSTPAGAKSAGSCAIGGQVP